MMRKEVLVNLVVCNSLSCDAYLGKYGGVETGEEIGRGKDSKGSPLFPLVSRFRRIADRLLLYQIRIGALRGVSSSLNNSRANPRFPRLCFFSSSRFAVSPNSISRVRLCRTGNVQRLRHRRFGVTADPLNGRWQGFRFVSFFLLHLTRKVNRALFFNFANSLQLREFFASFPRVRLPSNNHVPLLHLSSGASSFLWNTRPLTTHLASFPSQILARHPRIDRLSR